VGQTLRMGASSLGRTLLPPAPVRARVWARLRVRVQAAANVVLPVLIALLLVSVVLDSPKPLAVPLRRIGVLIAVGQGLALYWRHAYPRTVMAITAAGGLVIVLIEPTALFPFAGLVALWTLTTRAPPRVSLPALAALLLVTSLAWPTAASADTQFALVVVVAIWAIAEAVRSRRVAIDQASRQAALQEQARLARELHDVIAHSVSVIVVQAAAADDVFEQRPDRAREALRSIEAAGREALAELRRLLVAIGPVEPDVPDDVQQRRRPQPGLDRLEDLAEPLRRVGLRVEIRRADDGVEVPAGVALSVYRIVQEALTNVVRHAQARTVQVRVRIIEGAIEVSVTDDGQAGLLADPVAGSVAGPVAGRGITGMRERAELLGGTLEAGVRPGGGFRILARLPLELPR
jgi:signal transduction histidine kinase